MTELSVPSTPLQAALAAGLLKGGNLRAQLEALGDYPIDREDDAEAVCSALADLLAELADSPERWASQARGTAAPLFLLAGLLQDAASPPVFAAFNTVALPVLVEVFDVRWPERHNDPDPPLLLLKLFAMYNHPPGHQRVVAAAGEGFRADDLMWAVILRQVETDHPARHYFCQALRDPLPPAIIGAAYLNLCNRLALAGELLDHPFNTPTGHEILRELLRYAPASVAQAAATAIPFVHDLPQKELLELGLSHPGGWVELEAAWAAGRLDHQDGYRRLQEICRDPVRSEVAAGYLKSLSRGHLVPPETNTPAFRASARLIAWLAHDLEYGRPPEELSLVDSRELFWPPTNDRRQFWLFRFAYQEKSRSEQALATHQEALADQPQQSEEVAATESPSSAEHYGLVGSITFSLRTGVDVSIGDLYALHCCWELQIQHDARAPQQLNAQAGHQLLAAANPGWEATQS